MEYNYLYLLGIVLVCIILILVISSTIVKNKKVESQINIQVEGNMDVPIKVDEFKELKERFFKTFVKEKEMVVSIKDYEITFSKHDLSSIIVKRKGENESIESGLSSEDYSDMFNAEEESPVVGSLEENNNLAELGKEDSIKNGVQDESAVEEDNDEDELEDLMTIAGINDNAIHIELTSDDDEEIADTDYDINEE